MRRKEFLLGVVLYWTALRTRSSIDQSTPINLETRYALEYALAVKAKGIPFIGACFVQAAMRPLLDAVVMIQHGADCDAVCKSIIYSKLYSLTGDEAWKDAALATGLTQEDQNHKDIPRIALHLRFTRAELVSKLPRE